MDVCVAIREKWAAFWKAAWTESGGREEIFRLSGVYGRNRLAVWRFP
jgi:hypothetical protein